MNTFRILDGRARYLGAAIALTVATLITSVMPIVAGAAQITSRSVALSSSAVGATGVTYDVTFTPVANAGAFYIDFCSNTPLIGEACTAPTDFSVTGASTPTADWTEASASANSTLLTGTLEAGTPETVAIAGVANPSVAGTIYARITTYTDGTVAAAQHTAPATPGTYIDGGSVAISIANQISVSGDVLESLSFCVASAAISANCGDAASYPPTLTLGREVEAGVFALDEQEVSTGDIYSQISTNALGGAVVSMKSNALDCGGLLRSGAGTPAERCGIGPALSLGITAGDARFGVLVETGGTLDSGMTDPNGAFQASGTYNASTYEMNYVAGNGTGVTSTYGDPVLNTDGDPAYLRNAKLTFGASSNASVPAGRYTANISLVATGTF